jgi:mycoredoxin
LEHPDAITVYWRPGCGFCSGLLRSLERQGLSFERVNIWDDPEGAAFVRSVARGNETVPTVRVGDVAMVNPTTSAVLLAVHEQVPERVPAGWTPPEPSRFGKAVGRMLGAG